MSLTVEQKLALVGLGHRRDSNSVNDGKHIIIDAATGVELGRLDVFEAIKALEEAHYALSMEPADLDSWEAEDIMQDARERCVRVIGKAAANNLRQERGR